ncbi:MAG TPA: alpha/beta hydrolase [Chitinophaga sp.]|uniref:alpha/beta fold hydrolase n=1 Tax=Chitinophaga sp. TaxID=1869181 RepID=UPI002CB48D2E|nr:alpha/beta hydrolase [Chitinophaga sp.]HVI45760.1 alpha/beta hydrolase [Chitinophaga sp.]
MKKLLYLIPAILLVTNLCKGQKTDSIKYAHGYLYYHIYGQGQPVIMLSGGPGNSCQQQEEVAQELGRQYRVILLEQRGTGISIPIPFDSTTINMLAALDDLNRLLDHLSLKKALFYGHSWGAMLAMNFAATYPQRVKGLVLICPGYYKFSQEFFTTHVNNLKARMGLSELEQFDSLGKKINTGQATAADSAAYNRIMRMSYVFDKTIIDSLLKKIDVAKSNTTMQQLMIKDLSRINYDLSKTLYRYKGPFQVIAARQDALAFYAYELKNIHPVAKLHWIQASGHFPMFEQRKPFYDTLFTVMKGM